MVYVSWFNQMAFSYLMFFFQFPQCGNGTGTRFKWFPVGNYNQTTIEFLIWNSTLLIAKNYFEWCQWLIPRDLFRICQEGEKCWHMWTKRRLFCQPYVSESDLNFGWRAQGWGEHIEHRAEWQVLNADWNLHQAKTKNAFIEGIEVKSKVGWMVWAINFHGMSLCVYLA